MSAYKISNVYHKFFKNDLFGDFGRFLLFFWGIKQIICKLSQIKSVLNTFCLCDLFGAVLGQ